MFPVIKGATPLWCAYIH